uniref:Major facilitator superfamily (MFS) profile domain-containing protein n=1 Tax=Timema douglasi TaxID=61478 RepID=A0A7R8VUC5_TIMDO|nr:unnamed protein product [Timema douglasi]
MLGTKMKFTKRHWFTLALIGSVHFASAICISLQAPFYPPELVLHGLSMFQAESKGATATEYGFVFGVFELVSFICSPLIGKYVNVIGPKFLLKSGLFVAGICSMLFGFLHFAEGHAEFIGLSFAIRIVESVGASAATTAAFSITAAVFPDCVATTFVSSNRATLEVFYGLGYIVGPMIGGLLFSLGGFALPFLVVGCVLLLDGLIICLVLPSLDSDRKTTRKERKVPSIRRVFEIDHVLVSSVIDQACPTKLKGEINL